MKKLLVTLLLITIYAGRLHAQPFQVSGIVVNAESGKPLEGASVFINNASKGTVTDISGAFLIDGIYSANFELIISFVSFETIVVKITPQNIGKRFRVQMAEKENELQEVILAPVDKDGWKNWGKLFTDYFIGTSANAQQCVITNPKVLRFRYNKNERVLRVTAVDKLVIENRALGLVLNYQLEGFEYNSRRGMTTYFGYTSFSTIQVKRANKMKAWVAKRREAYTGSMMHFMRSFYSNRTVEEGFTLRQLIRLNKSDTSTLHLYNRIMQGDKTVFDTSRFVSQLMRGNTLDGAPIIYIMGRNLLPPESIRLVDTATREVQLVFNTNLVVDFSKEAELPDYATQQNPARKPRPFQSSIIFMLNNGSVIVDRNGNYADPLNVMAEGYWGWEKMAELLPVDYEIGE